MSPEPFDGDPWDGEQYLAGDRHPADAGVDLDDGFDEGLYADLPTTPVPDAPAPDAWASDRGGGARWASAGAPAGAAAGVEDLLRQAVELVASARRAPLSASVLIPRDDLLEILQRALEALPDELRQARWLLREREEFLAQRQREADELVETVRAQAERMVQRTEIVRQANQAAGRIVEDAREEARRLRHEAEEFCDKKLAAFEVVLERTARTVRAGRERLATPATAPATAAGGPASPEPRRPGRGAPRQDRPAPGRSADAGPDGSRPAATVVAAPTDGSPPFDQDRR